MKAPALLPYALHPYIEIDDDQELFDHLTKQPNDLITFFDYACDDETWSEEHSEFMRLILEWLTDKCLQTYSLADSARLAAKKIQEHIRILAPYLPHNIVFNVEGNLIQISSLLFGAASPVFQDFIVREWRDKNVQEAILSLSFDDFKTIEEFVCKGFAVDLWKKKEFELKRLRHSASEWGLVELRDQCEEILGRYIMRGNVYSMLIDAHQNHWLILRQACYNFINQLNYGCRLKDSSNEKMIFEFFDFKEPALDVFEKVKGFITHLVLSGSLIEENAFRSVVKQCPLLKGLDINHSRSFDQQLREVPKGLEELDISSCTWLNDKFIKILSEIFPRLKKLTINSNMQLGPNAWGTLQKFTALTKLDISRNSQIYDEDFKVIVASCIHLTDLICEDCKHITDKGFLEITRYLSSLAILDVSRCNLSNGALAELGLRCHFLRELYLRHCLNISDKGVLELVQQGKTLQKLDIRECRLRNETLAEIKRLKPLLQLEKD